MEKKHILTISVSFLAVLAIGTAALLQRDRPDLASLESETTVSEVTSAFDEVERALRNVPDMTTAEVSTVAVPDMVTSASVAQASRSLPETTAATRSVPVTKAVTPAVTTSPVAAIAQAPSAAETTPAPASTTVAPVMTTAATLATAPATVPVPSTYPPAAEPSGDYAAAVFELVNQERANAGLSALAYDEAVAASAQIRAVEIAESFSHTRPDGRSTFTVFADEGVTYTMAAENIAYGQTSAEEVMQGWMNSEGHRANILNGKLTSIGVGVYQKGKTLYWVQLFTRS